MAKIQYLTYYIHLTDAAQVAAYQAQYADAGGVNRAPYDPSVEGTGLPGGAAIEFAAPFRGYREPGAGEAPFIWTPWSGYETVVGPYPLDVATFTRKTGGWLGIGGTTTRYYWMGQFVYTPALVPGPPFPAPTPGGPGDGETPQVDVVPLATRRWCEGFEIPGQAVGKTTSLLHNRDAARHVGGMGLAMRGASATVSIDITEFDAARTEDDGWDRLYVRWRQAGDASVGIWRCHSAPTDGNGAALAITPSGQLAVENVIAGARNVLGTIADLTLNTWTRIDVLYEFAIGRLRVYVNGASAADMTMTTGFGAAGQSLRRITLGNVFAVTNDFECDLDDYVSADIPEGLPGAAAWAAAVAYALNDYVLSEGYLYRCDDAHTSALTNAPRTVEGRVIWFVHGGLDWLNGSKIALVRASAFTASHADWAGDVRVLLQNAQGALALQDLTSSVAGAVLDVDTDADQAVDADPLALGVVSMQVDLYATRGAASGELGYSLAGAAHVMVPITQAAGAAKTADAIIYAPAGLTAPVAITPLQLRHTKGAGADAATASQLMAQVEVIGVFGAEDILESLTDDDPPEALGFVGQHNAPYPHSPWAVNGRSAPIAPYIVIGGTYVGNGTGQDLQFRSPVHWYWVRPITGDIGGGKWWSTLLASHPEDNQGIEPHFVVRADQDVTFVPGPGEDAQQQRWLLRIAGAHTQSNALGVTYQYLAVCDPGMRFMLNTQLSHRPVLATDATALINPDFTPEWAFFWGENLSTTITTQLGVKSPGHAAASVTRVSGGTTADAMTLAGGSVTTQAAFHAFMSAHDQVGLSLWRRHDGNNDPGEAAVVSLGSYVGDGAASRTLTIGTAGKRPLFALVVGDTGGSYYRDPSHTTTGSTLLQNGTASAVGVTAGALDAITVGSSLNSNGVTYHYFLLWGGTTGGSGGFSINGEFIPVEAESPTDGPFPPDPPEPGPGDDVPTPDPDDVPVATDPDTGVACLTANLSVVNIALGYIGVSQAIVVVATDQTREAATVRLIFEPTIKAVLRDFPWPFATRYATLVLVDGSAADPANLDWIYSYRAPTDYVFARRLVRDGTGRGFDADPPPFKVGSDATGALLYTDVADAVLEYTARVPCAARVGDALFQDAVAWRLAHALAPALSRDSKMADKAWRMYLHTLGTAHAVAAREQQQASPQTGDPDWIRGR